MRLIDGDALWETLDDEPWYDNADRDEIALPIVAAALTVDAVVVTRCKDCKYADGKKETNVEKRYAADILFCRNPDFCGDEPLAMWPDDFCSYGEPKEGENA